MFYDDRLIDYHVLAANQRAHLPPNYQLEETCGYSEAHLEGDTWKWLDDITVPPGESEIAVIA